MIGATTTGLLAALTAMQAQPYWEPNNTRRLDHEGDLRWVMFRDALIFAEGIRGEYHATFSQMLSKMENIQFNISGHMLPIEASIHAALVPLRSAGCPFCPRNEPTEAIEVSDKPADYTLAPITASGRLDLIASSDAGLFHHLDHAKVI